MILTLSFLQDFSSRETDFHFHQFLSNFFKYFSSNFPSSFHLYSIFAINFPSSSLLLKSLSFAISNLSYLLTSTFILLSNSSNAFFVCSRFSLFSHVSCSTVNPFHLTKYFSTSLIFLLFKIFSTSHSLALFTLISFPSFFFCSPTCSLYCTI